MVDNLLERFKTRDFEDIKLSEIGSDLTTDTREKAQEVIVPTILVRIVGFALRKFD